jgi:hypothetical protein
MTGRQMAGGGSKGAGRAATGSGELGITAARLRCRQLSHGRRRIGSRRQLRHQGVDLSPRATDRPPEDRLVVLRSQVLAEEAHGGDRHLSARQQIEDHRKLPASSAA